MTGEQLSTYNGNMNKNKYLNEIRNFFRDRKRMPSYSEIMALAGFRSRNAAFKLVKRLVSLNFIEKDDTGKILPGKTFYELPLLGIVEAGFPSPAEEELVDTLTLDEFLIRNKEATYMLKVTGDSMIDAGILPGDIALVERGGEAKDGDIVIAQIDHQWTMKYFRKKGTKIFLEPANRKYKPIYPKQDLEIAAVVKSIIRKY